MSEPASSSSATALARTPLFVRLDRVERARLAGELEELAFGPGAVIVREGDPGDALFVINAGLVEVMVGAAPGEAPAPATVLGPGEVFGEMALLTDSPRTATVAARTEVTVWRLSRARFDALLDHERPIARAIERALSQRLAASTREAGALRATGAHLATAVVLGLPPDARALAAALAGRPAWTEATLGRILERTGTVRALPVLEAVPGLVRRREGRLILDPTFVRLAGTALGTPDPGWLTSGVSELRAAGEAVGAVDLALLAGPGVDTGRLLDETWPQLLEAATVADLDRWALRVRQVDPTVADRLAALRAALAARPVAVRPAAAHPRADRWARRLALPFRRLGAARLAGTGVALAVLAAGLLLPVPTGLDRSGLVTLAAILATVPVLMTGTLPDYVTMLLLVLVLVIPGLVPAPAVLGGFSTPAWLMILTLLAVGVAVARSGLMFRLVLLSLERLPPSYLVQSLVLIGAAILLTAGMTSVATRIALGVPIARGIADAMGFGRQSPGAAAVGLLGFYTFSLLGTLFVTGTFTGLVVQDLVPTQAGVTWWRWFFVALPPWVLMLSAFYVYLLYRFQPHRQARVNLSAVRTQRQLLGPLTRNETWSALGLVLLTVGFATRAYHGVSPAWLAVLLFVVLFAVGAIDASSVQGGGALSLLVYSGVILGLGDVFTAARIDGWLSGVVKSGMPPFVANPYGFVLVVGLIAFVLHFFVPWMTASTILALVTMPLAEGLGFHPFIPVIVALIAGDHTVAPYVNTSYAMFYFASEGELFSHDQARWTLVLEGAVRFLACVASVPVWQLMGLM